MQTQSPPAINPAIDRRRCNGGGGSIDERPEDRSLHHDHRHPRRTGGPGGLSNEQQTLLDTAMVAVLAIALIYGLAGFGFHVLWIAAIVAMALGLGFTFANSQRNRIDIVHQQADQRSLIQMRSDWRYKAQHARQDAGRS
jgi:hypothetical protein